MKFKILQNQSNATKSDICTIYHISVRIAAKYVDLTSHKKLTYIYVYIYVCVYI